MKTLLPSPPRTTSGRRALGAAAAGAAMVSWGFAGVLVKLTSMDDVTLTFYRAWLGLAVMLVILAAVRRRLTWKAVKASAVGGLFYAVQVGLFFAALKRTSVADVMLIGALQPVLVLFVAGRWFGEAVDRWKVIWTVVSLIGVTIVIFGSAGTPVWSAAGDLFAVAALVTFTGYWLASKRLRAETKVGAIEYMTAVMVFTVLVVTPVALLAGSDLTTVRPADWLWLALFVLLPGAGGHLVMNWAHRYVDVTLSSLMIVAVPVIAAVAARVVLGEPLGPMQVVGGLIVVGAIGAFLMRERAGQGLADDEWEAAVPGTAPPP